MTASPLETVLIQYRYDPLDRQTGCTLLTLPAIQRFYRDSRLATEIQGALRTSVFQHDNQLLAQQRRQDGKANTILLATDQQRSVLAAQALTGSHQLAYSPYGHRPADNGLLSLLGFNGERPDPVTGHYHLGNGYRQFNPVLMRFNSPDSWSPFGKGGVNAYGYCGGEPINRSDPNGHEFVRSLINLMTKQLKALPNHPTKEVGKLTKILLKSSKEKLGGKKGIEKLANESGLKRETVLLKHVYERIEKALTGEFALSRRVLEAGSRPSRRSHALKLNISRFRDALDDLSQGAKQFLEPGIGLKINKLYLIAKDRVQELNVHRLLPAYSEYQPPPSPPPTYFFPDSAPPLSRQGNMVRGS